MTNVPPSSPPCQRRMPNTTLCTQGEGATRDGKCVCVIVRAYGGGDGRVGE